MDSFEKAIGKEPEQPSKSKRALMRGLLAAAIASAAPAKAEDAKNYRGAEAFAEKALAHTYYAKKMPESVRKIRFDENRLTEYRSRLQAKMKGAHLEFGGFETQQSIYGFHQFCIEYADYCDLFAKQHPNIQYETFLSPERFKLLMQINFAVNKTIEPKSDWELYEVNEKWKVGVDLGDCEDYALLKLMYLIDAKFAPESLHLLVVRDEKNEGHAILGVDVWDGQTRNTLILDNKNFDIITLDEMEKKYTGQLASFTIDNEASGKHEVHFFRYVTSENKEQIKGRFVRMPPLIPREEPDSHRIISKDAAVTPKASPPGAEVTQRPGKGKSTTAKPAKP